MNFELINGSHLKISLTRKLGYRERILNLAVFLTQYLVTVQENATTNHFLRSICALLPFLLSTRCPFISGNAPHWNAKREQKRVSRLAVYCGVNVTLCCGGGVSSSAWLQTDDNLGAPRAHLKRCAGSIMASYIQRFQTPLFQSAEGFSRFLRVWTHHCESVVERSIPKLLVDRGLIVELWHLGHCLLDLLSSDDIYHARRLSRIALRLHRIYGESIAMDVCRLAHLPRSINLKGGEDYLHGSQIQKELQ
ncbi:putative P0 protein [Pepper vein yellows virus]|uniref:Putative P0 protein n=1 Tax=Pepper vein yellows virus TaxID=909827 RepID=A0A165CZU1_9VIRU|nr:putative P0 protein [Pepper vein yellows virus]AMX74034.1 putative P0 protein [Pepper vein yellows virus]